MMRPFAFALCLAACVLAQDELRIRTLAGNGSGDEPKTAAVAEGAAFAVAFDAQQRAYVGATGV
jgi:hypothetical protein